MTILHDLKVNPQTKSADIITPNLDAIREALSVTCVPGEVYEIRVPKTEAGTVSGYFDDLDAMSEWAYALTLGTTVKGMFGPKSIAPPMAVYATLNPGSRDLLATCKNRVQAIVKGVGSTDKDIIRRTRLYIDTDPWRRMGISSTDEGHEHALARVREIRHWLAGKGFPAPLFADSGNGGHLLYGLDLPADDDALKLIKRFLAVLAARFGDPCEKDKTPFDDRLIHVDPTVCNAARVGAVYGTMKRKGDALPERPHRMARILESPKLLEAIPRELLEAVVAEGMPASTAVDAGTASTKPAGTTKPEARVEGKASEPPGASDPGVDIKSIIADRLRAAGGMVNLKSKLDGWGVQVGKVRTKGDWTTYPIPACLFNPDHKGAGISQKNTGAIAYSCPHDSCRGKGKYDPATKKTWADVCRHFGEEPTTTGRPAKEEKEPVAAKMVKFALGHSKVICDVASEVTSATFVDVDGTRMTVPVKGAAFKNWLCRSYREATGKSVKGADLADAIVNIAAAYAARVPTFRRVARVDDVIYIDTLNQGKVIRVTAAGWDIVDDAPVVFETRKDMGRLPLPGRDGDLAELWDFMNVEGEDRPLVLCYLLSALAGRKPYPILLASGRQGSAKSSFAGFVVGLVDPAIKAPTKDLAESKRDLAIQARNRHLIAYDNLSRISPEMSDAFCRISTGAGFSVRGLYHDDEECIFGGANPVLFNGIPELGDRPDFLSRAIRVRLPWIPPERRQDEKTLGARFEARRPYLLGALLDLLANGLRNEGSIGNDGKAPRLIDAYKWYQACELGTGMDLAARFRDQCDDLQRDVAFDTLIGKSVRGFVEEMRGDGDVWEGTPGALYNKLNTRWKIACDGDFKQLALFPGAPNRLMNLLDAAAPPLALHGIVFSRKKSNGKRLARIDATGYFADLNQGDLDEEHEPEPEPLLDRATLIFPDRPDLQDAYRRRAAGS